jgi:hypothetical protein
VRTSSSFRSISEALSFNRNIGNTSAESVSIVRDFGQRPFTRYLTVLRGPLSVSGETEPIRIELMAVGGHIGIPMYFQTVCWPIALRSQKSNLLRSLLQKRRSNARRRLHQLTCTLLPHSTRPSA